MDTLLNLSMPWWHFVVRGALTYLTLLLLLRLAGKRSFGELSPFDVVVLILVGGALRISAEGFARKLRPHGVASIADVGVALLEPNGEITVLKRDAVRSEDPLRAQA